MTDTTLESLLVDNVPRDLVMGVEDALRSAAQRGFDLAGGMHLGHRAHAVGQMRHFQMNEAFRESLEASGANPTAIRGNSLVVGQAGIFMLGRFNISNEVWSNGRRSKARREMAYANKAIETLVMPDLFDTYRPAIKATAFFVAVFDRSVQHSQARPVSIDLAVPDPEMKGWLLRKPLTEIIKLYEKQVVAQPDLATPTLKSGIGISLTRKSGT